MKNLASLTKALFQSCRVIGTEVEGNLTEIDECTVLSHLKTQG